MNVICEPLKNNQDATINFWLSLISLVPNYIGASFFIVTILHSITALILIPKHRTFKDGHASKINDFNDAIFLKKTIHAASISISSISLYFYCSIPSLEKMKAYPPLDCLQNFGIYFTIAGAALVIILLTLNTINNRKIN